MPRYCQVECIKSNSSIVFHLITYIVFNAFDIAMSTERLKHDGRPDANHLAIY